MKNYLKFAIVFLSLSVHANTTPVKPDVLVEKGSSKAMPSTSSLNPSTRYVIPDIELDMYFLKGSSNSDGFFVADSAQAKCDQYQSFREFLKAANFKALDGTSEGVVAAAYGQVFLPHGKSCFELKSDIYTEWPKASVMAYRVSVYAISEFANQELKTYVESTKGKTFFGKPIEYEKVDTIHCEWTLNSFLDDEWFASVNYHSLEARLRGIHREMNRLGQLMEENPSERALLSFLADRNIPTKNLVEFFRLSKSGNRFELSCRMKVVSGFNTYHTYWAREQGYKCEGTKCTQVAEW